ncbi:metallophosphoesterase family protein [Schlesneria paludicola]|uniref:metallophosphoesterase family protein n=1 Tax=Schlesneria paludicola TaxID=360056 RepID=UPI00029A35A5|nr:DNA repair exonuclease [Schlesneria paludicola]
MKFLHAADIHLDSPLLGLERYEGAPVELIRGATRRALENLVALAMRERVDVVVIAGDLYDGSWRDFNTGMFFVRQMAKLRDAGIRVYLIAGNHDAASMMTKKLRLPVNPEGDSLMLSHEQPETRHIPDLGLAVHGRSFANAAELKNMVPDYPGPIPHSFNLGLLHTSLNGSDEHDTYAPCTPADLRAKGYDYWALGHIHKRSSIPEDAMSTTAAPALYSGNIQGRHIRESGSRGCLLATVNEQGRVNLTFHPLDVFRWEVCSVSCSDAEDSEEILSRVRTELHRVLQLHGELPLGVRVSLEGRTRAHQEVCSHREAITAEIRTLGAIESDGRVWVEQVKFHTSYPQAQHLSLEDHGPLAELVRYLDELPENSAALQQLADELKDLARKLPGELTQSAEGLRLDQPDWIRSLIPDLKPMLLDRLKGES